MAKRRQWMDDLKSKNDELNVRKKPKVQILSEIIYKQGTVVEIRSPSHGKAVTVLPSTPHSDNRIFYENLTPTFRNPSTYLQETKEVLKQITPCKLDNNSSPKPSVTETDIVPTGNLEFNNSGSFSFSQSSFNHSYMVSVTVDSVQDTNNYDLPKNENEPEHLLSVLTLEKRHVDVVPVLNHRRAGNVSRSMSLDVHAVPINTLPDLHHRRAASVPQNMLFHADPVHVNVLLDLFSPTKRISRSTSCKIYPMFDILPDLHHRRAVSVPRNMLLNAKVVADNTLLDTYLCCNVSPRNNVNSTGYLESGIPENQRSAEKSHPGSDSPIPGTCNTYFHHLFSPFSSASNSMMTQSDNGRTIELSKKSQSRKSKRNLDFNISYLDFVDEDSDTILLNDAFPSDNSDSWNESSDESSEAANTPKVKKRKTKNILRKTNVKNGCTETESEAINIEKSSTKSQIKLQNHKNKQQGESYINTKGKIIEKKEMKTNPCIKNACQNNCAEITEERRSALFNYFWSLTSSQRRKDWIAQATVKKSVKRSKFNSPTSSRRSVTYNYYINEGESRRPVCQQFLLATLNVTQRFILYTVENSSHDGFAKLDQRGKHTSHNRTPAEVTEYAKSFIYSLPLLPSHYCRKDSKRLYLPEEFKNMTTLYSIYVNKCRDENQKSMSLKVFSAYFKNNFNIAFHVPKKDKCLICSIKSYDVLTQEETDKLNRHLIDKENSKNRFLFHQSLYEKDKSLVCASFDLQKVLNTPYGTQNMSLYYSRKIAVYNFTIYESGTRNGFCNVWTEVDAHRGANEISSCLFNYITNNIEKRGNIKTLLLYCDSCYGQNKNQIVLAMLRYALSKCENLEIIQINYLTPGHTYMPVDSMHATIERMVRKTTVWAPSQWPTIMEVARKNPFPYEVSVRDGNFFMSFNDIANKLLKKKQNLHISDISIVIFKKNKPNVMFIKRSMANDAECSEISLGDIGNTKPKENLYKGKLPISSQKYKDLKNLVQKKIVPPNYAKEFLDLDHNNRKVDHLPDTDEED